MKRFVFRLQRVLDIRLREEELARNEVAKANGEYQLELSKLRHLESERERVRNSMSMFGTIPAEYFLNYQRFVEGINFKIEEQKKVVAEKREILQKAVDKLKDAVVKRKVLEKLKERKYKEYMKEFIREEDKMLSDVGESVWLRKSKND